MARAASTSFLTVLTMGVSWSSRDRERFDYIRPHHARSRLTSLASSPALQRVLRALRAPDARGRLEPEGLLPPHARDARLVREQGLHVAQGLRIAWRSHSLGLGSSRLFLSADSSFMRMLTSIELSAYRSLRRGSYCEVSSSRQLRLLQAGIVRDPRADCQQAAGIP